MCSAPLFKPLFVVFIAIDIVLCLDVAHSRIITVALSEQKPFVIIGEDDSPKGLDVSIIENFAKKLSLQINYVVINSSLNHMFSNEISFNPYSAHSSLRYVKLCNLSSFSMKFLHQHFVQER